jgi:hypothetical protein
MSKSKPPSPEVVQAKLESIRPDGTTDIPLKPEDVTAVLHLAIDRLSDVQEQAHEAILRATERLRNETRQTVAATRALTDPPKASKE